ncbi:MAG: PIN domain-containing protein, partial [Candidatus Saccharibacteria bacterium]
MTDNIVTSLALVAGLFVALGILRLRRLSLQSLVFIITGSIIGLLLGALVSVPLGKLPNPAGGLLPILASIILTFASISAIWSRRSHILHMLPFLQMDPTIGSSAASVAPGTSSRILVDTSVIIDGRIADIAVAGFIPGRLLIPRFVLAELQNIADSEDAMRRSRGRRGLEVLNRLRDTNGIEVEIIEEDVQAIKEVDAKLVSLAQTFSCDVLTTDYNLNRVAQIQGVRVLNINELANAIRPVVLPGEEMLVRVVQPGKEKNQGVGYLADGTMIVVENGDKLMGQEVSTEVTRVFQTVAGKMIFAVPRKGFEPKAIQPVDTTAHIMEEIRPEVPASLAEHTAAKNQYKRNHQPRQERHRNEAQATPTPGLNRIPGRPQRPKKPNLS